MLIPLMVQSARAAADRFSRHLRLSDGRLKWSLARVSSPSIFMMHLMYASSTSGGRLCRVSAATRPVGARAISANNRLPPNGRAFSGEPSERSEWLERMRGRRVRCNAMLDSGLRRSQIKTPSSGPAPHQICGDRNHSERNDRRARLQREQRRIVHHEMDIRRHNHDADHDQPCQSDEKANTESKTYGDFNKRHAPPRDRVQRNVRGHKLTRPSVCEHWDQELHGASHQEQDCECQPETGCEPAAGCSANASDGHLAGVPLGATRWSAVFPLLSSGRPFSGERRGATRVRCNGMLGSSNYFRDLQAS
jgi:hypothetical protein